MRGLAFNREGRRRFNKGRGIPVLINWRSLVSSLDVEPRIRHVPREFAPSAVMPGALSEREEVDPV